MCRRTAWPPPHKLSVQMQMKEKLKTYLCVFYYNYCQHIHKYTLLHGAKEKSFFFLRVYFKFSEVASTEQAPHTVTGYFLRDAASVFSLAPSVAAVWVFLLLHNITHSGR